MTERNTKPLLSPLLGRFTAQEFHQNLMGRICPSCELESVNKPIQDVLKYNWKMRDFEQIELFQPKWVDYECPHHP